MSSPFFCVALRLLGSALTPTYPNVVSTRRQKTEIRVTRILCDTGTMEEAKQSLRLVVE